MNRPLTASAVRAVARFDVTSVPVGVHRFVRVIGGPELGESGIPINVARGQADGPLVVLIAGVHGDEHEGPLALIEITELLEQRAPAGTVVVVPVANPLAFQASSRATPEDGENLNRILPSQSKGSVTHRLGAVILDEVVPGADFVLTLHGWSAGSLTVPFVEYTAGHATTERCHAGALSLRLPYVEPLGLPPGRLMTALAAMGIAGCEAEIGGEGIALPDRTALAVAIVRRLLGHLGSLAPTAETLPAASEVRRIEVAAPTAGILRQGAARVGDQVARGDLLATISDLNGTRLADIAAPSAGVLALRRHAAPVAEGDLVAAVFVDAASG